MAGSSWRQLQGLNKVDIFCYVFFLCIGKKAHAVFSCRKRRTKDNRKFHGESWVDMKLDWIWSAKFGLVKGAG